MWMYVCIYGILGDWLRITKIHVCGCVCVVCWSLTSSKSQSYVYIWLHTHVHVVCVELGNDSLRISLVFAFQLSRYSYALNSLQTPGKLLSSPGPLSHTQMRKWRRAPWKMLVALSLCFALFHINICQEAEGDSWRASYRQCNYFRSSVWLFKGARKAKLA